MKVCQIGINMDKYWIIKDKSSVYFGSSRFCTVVVNSQIFFHVDVDKKSQHHTNDDFHKI